MGWLVRSVCACVDDTYVGVLHEALLIGLALAVTITPVVHHEDITRKRAVQYVAHRQPESNVCKAGGRRVEGAWAW
jgi:hypothetical protein